MTAGLPLSPPRTTMTANRRQRNRTERIRLGRSGALPLMVCIGCVVQTGTGFVGHVPRPPSTAAATWPAAVHHRSWPSSQPEPRDRHTPRRQGRAEPGDALAAARGSLAPPHRESSRRGDESVQMVGRAFEAAAGRGIGRRPTTALAAAADRRSGGGGSSGAKVEVAGDKPRRRRGPGRKTLAAAARNGSPVPEATKAASYAIAQAASAGRAAAVEAMEREEADREALNALAGEQREELRASIAEGRGPTVLVSKQGFEPVEQQQKQQQQQRQRQYKPPRQELEKEQEEEEEEEEEEDEDEYDDEDDEEDDEEDDDDEDEDGEPKAKKKTKEELDKEEARQDALAANIQVGQGVRCPA